MNLSRHFLPLTLLAGLGLTGPARAATTFTRDVAAIVFQHCAPCHRPGQGGPFPLLTFADCRKHATDLADVTGRRYMPPWLPTGPVNEFVGDRRLTDAEIAVFKAWLADGSPEGEAKDLPPLPAWPGEWQLGTPDVVAQMPAAYTLQPGGRDVYRHFALPLTQPLDRPRWIRAFEFHPGSRQVHHAFLYVARNNDVQRLDAADPVVGFGGMDTPTEVHSPGGYFLSWQPGKRTLPLPAGMGWKLEPGTALVMQMHLQPGGKPEPIQAGVGLWFADSPATNQPLKLGLNIYDLDLAPGQSNLVYTREFVLPGDTDLLGVLPHTHYLGRRIEAWAELPDQTRRDLLTIPDWDFNWQGDYRYATPVFLPRGTKLGMKFVFDNTTANPRNPSNPPRRVGFGMSTSDEMGELWFQLLPRTARDRSAMDRALGVQTAQDIIAYNGVRLKANPTNAIALVNLARANLVLGDQAGSFQALTNAVALDPANDEGHYYLGLIHRLAGRTGPAMEEFQRAVEANPAHGRAHGNLGILAEEQNRPEEAAEHFTAALQADPDDNLARTSLAQIRLGQGNRPEAIRLMEEAVRHDPADPDLARQLKLLKTLR